LQSELVRKKLFVTEAPWIYPWSANNHLEKTTAFV